MELPLFSEQRMNCAWFRNGLSAQTSLSRNLVKNRQLSTIRKVQGPVSIKVFRFDAFEPGNPLAIRDFAGEEGQLLPALTKWFTNTAQPKQRACLTPYFEQHSHINLPYELILPPDNETSQFGESVTHFLDWLSHTGDAIHNSLAELLRDHLSYLPPSPAFHSRFLRFEAPAALLSVGLEFNNSRNDSRCLLEQLYIAQAPLSALPVDLQNDVPTPELVKEAGKGDIYDSSIWIGLEPTYTPWHRDPNPNLFCQLQSSKVIRMLPPRHGEQLFLQTRAKLGQTGSSRIRGEEMMQGAERQVLYDTVWSDSVIEEDMMEVTLTRGDALYIPKGWWHSVRSEGGRGTLNASVNWWFR